MNIFYLIKDLEENVDIHLSRLLILINSFSNNNPDSGIKGITKLAKLDFLLRYPVNLERALLAIEKKTNQIQIKDFERDSVESQMIRFRYGPWDFRYRKFLNILSARGLVNVKIIGRTTYINISEKGSQIIKELEKEGEFNDYFNRSKIIKRYFDMGATQLMNFIYKTFKEISTMQWGERINNEPKIY